MNELLEAANNLPASGALFVICVLVIGLLWKALDLLSHVLNKPKKK